eukprot:scaffold79652_cov24-Tisochrysis_lutea.AAC.2
MCWNPGLSALLVPLLAACRYVKELSIKLVDASADGGQSAANAQELEGLIKDVVSPFPCFHIAQRCPPLYTEW